MPIVFANVPRDSIDVAQMQAVRDAVHQQGIGFLMIGGKNSYGPGGYNRTPIEETLPVDMDVKQRKVMPKGALAIILHTCEFPDGNTWAKRITKSAIKVLSDQDEVGVLAHMWGGAQGQRDTWVFPLTPAAEYEELSLKINAAEIGDMLTFGPAMQLGFNALKASDAAMKHMLIISDGDPTPPTPALPPGIRSEWLYHLDHPHPSPQPVKWPGPPSDAASGQGHRRPPLLSEGSAPATFHLHQGGEGTKAEHDPKYHLCS